MNDNATLAQEMIAIAPVASRNTRMHMEAEGFVGLGRMPLSIIDQTNICNHVPFLFNRYNVI